MAESTFQNSKYEPSLCAHLMPIQINSFDSDVFFSFFFQSAASHGASKVKKEDTPNDKKANPTPEYKGDKSIEEILDFIEGNKSGNMKRTAKKMRRKQRQVR